MISSLCFFRVQALSYIEKNGVHLIKPESMEVEGSVILTGISTKNKIKVMVHKDDFQEWYDIEPNDGNFSKRIWLNQGEGKYYIYIMVNEEGRNYSFGPKLSIVNTRRLEKFLYPEKHIESDDEEIIKLAKELTHSTKGDLEKARSIYNWVKDNIKYDYEKYKKHQINNYDNDYGALNTLRDLKGVCYDYATLTAALGRASGLKTKVVAGLGKLGGFEGYHAWNEIYISEEDKWVKLDTTFAAVSKKEFFDNENFDESHIKQDKK